MPRTMNILLVGGGTLGHVAPVLAVAEQLRRIAPTIGTTIELQYIGRRKGAEQATVERAGIPYIGISAGKLRRYVDLQNLVDPIRVMIGFFQSLVILLRFRPTVVFAKGGYVSLPVVMAATVFRIPIVAHETDSVLGLANRLAARASALLCVGFPVDRYQHQGVRARLVYTGNPVRAEFFSARRPIRTKPPYTVVVFGGSQGSLAINRSLEALIEHPLSRCSIIHLTGRAHYDEFAPRASTQYHPSDYTDHLADLFQHADLVIARSGGSAFELAAAARPSILIPLSSSANQHQQSNARYFSDERAAIVIDESELTPEGLRACVAKVLAAPAERRQLSRRIEKLAVPDAAERVARVIFEAAGQPK